MTTTLQKIEETFIDIEKYISNYRNATKLEMRIYWLKQINVASQIISSEIKDFLSV